jgi:hypothetical protein
MLFNPAARAVFTPVYSAPPAVFTTPKIAAFDYSYSSTGSHYTGAWADAISQFDVVVLQMTSSYSAVGRAAVVASIKSRNPSAMVFQYTCLTTSPAGDCDTVNVTVGADAPITQNAKLSAANWWLYNSPTSHIDANRCTFIGVNACNTGSNTVVDASGRRWPQWYAQAICTTYQRVAGLDGFFLDVFEYPNTLSAPGDWLYDGSTTQVWSLPNIKALVRAGHRAQLDTIRGIWPASICIGNMDQLYTSEIMQSAELSGQMNGVLYEGMLGKPTYSEQLFSNLIPRYQLMQNQVIPPGIVLTESVNQGGRPVYSDDYQGMRFALCTTMLGDGYCAYTPTGSFTITPLLYDEYSVLIGAAVDPPQWTRLNLLSPFGSMNSAIYGRRYANGIVLLNSDYAGSHTVSYAALTADGRAYKRFSGTQVPSVNSGANITADFTLAANDAVMLILQ